MPVSLRLLLACAMRAFGHLRKLQRLPGTMRSAMSVPHEKLPKNIPEVRRRRMFQISLVVAIPWLTTFFVLGLGLAMIQIHRHLLLSPGSHPTVVDVQKMISDTVLAVIIAAVGALLAGVVLALALMRPFREIERKTRSIAAGDLTGRVRLGPGTEFIELEDAFNRMATSLNEYFIKGPARGTITVGADGTVTSVSGDAAALLECAEDVLVGRPLNATFLGADDNAPFLSLARSVLDRREPHPSTEIALFTYLGRTVSVKVSASLLRDSIHATPGALLAIEDISNEKRLREELRRIDRLAALNGLAAGVAHQVRNPLCSIRGFAQLVGESAEADDATRGAAQNIVRQADRINATITNMLETLRPGTPEWDYGRVDEVVAKILRKNNT